MTHLSFSLSNSANQEGYIRFIEAQGFRVFEFQGGLWSNKRQFFFESIPQHRQLNLQNADLSGLFRHGAAVLRYTCNEQQGDKSFEYVCSEKGFSLESLSPDARRRVRRGLESCEIRPVEFDLLARYGCAINRDTLARQCRAGVSWMTDEDLWKKYMTACSAIPNVYAFGAFLNDRFCGFSMTVTIDDYAYLFHTQAFAEDLKYSPVNALTYTVTKTMLENAGINHASQGLESFVPLPEVEKFKLGMGFRKRVLGRRVLIHPFAKPLFSAPIVWLAKKTVGTFKLGLVEDFEKFTKSISIRETSLRSTEYSPAPTRSSN